MTDPAAWPTDLRELVKQHGAGVVWHAGYLALGFPPTWATTGDEFAAVESAVRMRRPTPQHGAGHE